jgi:hypothetical protein
MRPRNTIVLVGAAVLLLCRAAADPGGAKVVRDPGGPASNPGVETGGLHLPPQPPPPIPYSLIGAIASDGAWLMQCALWPWQQFGAMGWFRHHWPVDERRTLRRIERRRR